MDRYPRLLHGGGNEGQDDTHHPENGGSGAGAVEGPSEGRHDDQTGRQVGDDGNQVIFRDEKNDAAIDGEADAGEEADHSGDARPEHDGGAESPTRRRRGSDGNHRQRPQDAVPGRRLIGKEPVTGSTQCRRRRQAQEEGGQPVAGRVVRGCPAHQQIRE